MCYEYRDTAPDNGFYCWDRNPLTLTQVVHLVLFDTVHTGAEERKKNAPIWIQRVLGLSCSISAASAQVIKREPLLPVHYTETKWNHNENLPLTVSHHCIIPLPPFRRRLLSQIIKRGHWCFPLPGSCFLFLT